MTREEFIDKALKCHEEGEVDYSQVVYVNSKTKVKLIDKIYGEYWQTPSNHLKGHSHPLRRKEKISRRRSLDEEEVIRRFKEVHHDEELDYSKVTYKNMHTKVCIIDPIYGEYWQEPIVHLKGCGHPLRGKENTIKSNQYSNDDFIRLCKQVHLDYDYSVTDYKSSREKVSVICPKHGIFNALPNNLLQGKGCPRCGHHLSKAEDEIAELLREKIGDDNVIQGDKEVLDGKEIDIYVPSMKLGIEFNGLRWHCDKYSKDSDYHLSKTIGANAKGVGLLQIFEDEWKSFKDKITISLLHKIGASSRPKIDGRKCNIVENEDAIYCFYKETQVGKLCFELVGERKCLIKLLDTNYGYQCRGVCGKLVSYLERKYNLNEMAIIVDRRWLCNVNCNLFTKLGFKASRFLPPTFEYTDGKIRSKDKLEHKIWNCGYVEFKKIANSLA